MRWFQRVAAVAAAVAVVGGPAVAKIMIAMKPPVQRAISADVVVVGKVKSVGQDDVEVVAPYPGATNKVRYKVATVTIDSVLVGADKMAEIKVGFAQPPKPDPNAKPGGPIRPGGPRGPVAAIEPKEGQEWLLFLAKHPTADFYVIPNMSQPVDVSNEAGKKELEAVKKVLALLADPMKGLKSDKPEVRAETACALVTKYRSYPDLGGETEQVAIPAEESKLTLKGLAEAEWSNTLRPGAAAGEPNAMQAFNMLGLTAKDGWVPPAIVVQPGGPAPDYAAIHKDAFLRWLEGPGKDYRIKKFVPAKK
jgi:hypothetical protein